MGGAEDRFSIDPDELDEVILDLQKCEQELQELADDLDRHMQTLQEQWEGLAADAQAEAHAEWTQGMLAMRSALGDLRAAARTAHGNYTTAARTNREMWSRLQ